jgi:hypothetical protein
MLKAFIFSFKPILHLCFKFIVTFAFFYSGSRSSKTFKPKKNIPEGTHQYDLMKHAAATLGSGNLRLAVMLPEGEDLNEWVAVNSKYGSSLDCIEPGILFLFHPVVRHINSFLIVGALFQESTDKSLFIRLRAVMPNLG